MIATYTLISTIMLGWVASIWDSKGYLNITLKTGFVIAAAFGAICYAKLAL